jgi:hypothetical protein
MAEQCALNRAQVNFPSTLLRYCIMYARVARGFTEAATTFNAKETLCQGERNTQLVRVGVFLIPNDLGVSAVWLMA